MVLKRKMGYKKQSISLYAHSPVWSKLPHLGHWQPYNHLPAKENKLQCIKETFSN
jgi:hypothetical protein